MFAAFAAALISISCAPPAMAHKEHREEQQKQHAAAAVRQKAQAASGQMTVGQMHENMDEMMIEPTDRSEVGVLGRLLDWLGRLHPIIVHFPIAFFPAALFTAIVGRRRPAFGAPVQFLVVAGGVLAPISALLGWFNGGWVTSDADPLLAVHRWLGTGIGIGGFALAVWAWRRPWKDREAGMMLALALMTLAIAVQGWFGGALVHGAEHLNW